MTAPWHSLSGKRIWMAGGAGHFGTAITLALDAAGASVVCIDRDGRAAQVVRENSLVHTVAIDRDLTAVETLEATVDTLFADYGAPDGMVHLSYASYGAGQSFSDLSARTFAATVGDNLTSTFVFCRAVAERMKARGSGSLVLFSSMYGLVAPHPSIYLPPMQPNSIDYGVAKSGILQLARYFAVHYGPQGIRCNAVTPGAFPHPHLQRSDPGFVDRLGHMCPLGRIGQAHEMVGPTLFLLTDSASFVTGQNLIVDGGWTAW